MKESNPFQHEDDPLAKPSDKRNQGKNLGFAALERKSPDRAPAPEARQLHVGHVLLAAESSGRREKSSDHKPDLVTEKRVSTLSRTELLKLSDKIVVDGTTLRQIYESHLIGERGLRHLLTEHVRGGDLSKALRREILEREIDFERDPALRDMTSLDQTVSTTTEVNSEALNKLLEKVTMGGHDEGEEAAFYRARADFEVQQLQQQHQQRRIVDIVITLTISVLVMIIIILYLTKG